MKRFERILQYRLLRLVLPAAAVASLVLALSAIVRVADATPGETTSPVLDVPCWLNAAAAPGPSGSPEVIVGTLSGRLRSTGATVTADAFYDDEAGDCGLNDLVYTSYPPETPFKIRVDSAIAFDEHPTANGTVELDLEVRRWSDANCTGTPSSLITKYNDIVFPLATGVTQDWYEINPLGTAISVDSTSPIANGTDSWWYRVRATIGATTTFDDGCFNIKAGP